MSVFEIDNIFSLVDVDGTGAIEFFEFLLIALRPSEVINKEKVARAFDDFRGRKTAVKLDDIIKGLGLVSTIREDQWRLVLSLDD